MNTTAMTSECGPWRSCDFHQYRSWLRRAGSASSATPQPEKERQKTKRGKRRPMPGEYHLMFRHHTDPDDFERDYVSQVTNARCRAANPTASLSAMEPPERPKSRCVAPLAAESSRAAEVDVAAPSPAAEVDVAAPSPAAVGLLTASTHVTASTPDLSRLPDARPPPPPPPPPPLSTPDLYQLPPIAGLRPAWRPPPPHAVRLPPDSSAAAARQWVTQPAPGVCGTRRDDRQSTVGSGARHRPRRQPPRQTSTPHMVTLDLPAAADAVGPVAEARRNCYNKPKGLTKIQFGTLVPGNLTIIVGRKLEISVSSTKKSQRSHGFRYN